MHRVVERRNTIPILSNVLLRAVGSTLQLRATDLELDITETVAADVGEAGATTLPAHTLYDIVRKLPDGAQVSLETTGEAGQLQLRSGRCAAFPSMAAQGGVWCYITTPARCELLYSNSKIMSMTSSDVV